MDKLFAKAKALEADAAEKTQKAVEEKKAIASINRLRDQIMAADEMDEIDAGWDNIVVEQKAPAKKTSWNMTAQEMDEIDAGWDDIVAQTSGKTAQVLNDSAQAEIELDENDFIEVTDHTTEEIVELDESDFIEIYPSKKA